MTRVAIVGASGYSGEELVRLLLHHPRVRLSWLTSRQNAGRSVAEVFPKFASHCASKTLRFIESKVETLLSKIGKDHLSTVVFLALPHGVAAEWAGPLLKKGLRVIDLSADFRLKDAARYQEFYSQPHPCPNLLQKAVYGLPEIRRAAIRKARLIASPGCYPTGILLPLIPLLRARLIKPHGIIVNSLSGVSGAGRKPEDTSLFCECNESARPYGVPKHRHLSEIEQELGAAARQTVIIQFTPHLIPINRGIITTIYARPEDKIPDIPAAVTRCLEKAYRRESFIRLLPPALLPDTKNVAATNIIEIAHRFDPRTGRLILFSAQDNLVKGASGQAVQCMNLLCRFPETTGLV